MKGTIFHAYIISYVSLAITVVAFLVSTVDILSLHLINISKKDICNNLLSISLY